MNERQDLENLMFKVQKMRQKQREYFATRNNVVKRQAIELEKEVDQTLIAYISKGYKPFDSGVQQRTIF